MKHNAFSGLAIEEVAVRVLPAPRLELGVGVGLELVAKLDYHGPGDLLIVNSGRYAVMPNVQVKRLSMIFATTPTNFASQLQPGC